MLQLIWGASHPQSRAIKSQLTNETFEKDLSFLFLSLFLPHFVADTFEAGGLGSVALLTAPKATGLECRLRLRRFQHVTQ